MVHFDDNKSHSYIKVFKTKKHFFLVLNLISFGDEGWEERDQLINKKCFNEKN